MSMNADYTRRRRAAIKAGTWNPRRAAEPTCEPSAIDLAWAAGFIEGEGTIGSSGTSLKLAVGQKEREPLDRLLAIFGGSVHFTERKKYEQNPIYVWTANGARARSIIERLYSQLSSRRRAQADRALDCHQVRDHHPEDEELIGA